jgi:hypothetical protein
MLRESMKATNKKAKAQITLANQCQIPAGQTQTNGQNGGEERQTHVSPHKKKKKKAHKRPKRTT